MQEATVNCPLQPRESVALPSLPLPSLRSWRRSLRGVQSHQRLRALGASPFSSARAQRPFDCAARPQPDPHRTRIQQETMSATQAHSRAGGQRRTMISPDLFQPCGPMGMGSALPSKPRDGCGAPAVRRLVTQACWFFVPRYATMCIFRRLLDVGRKGTKERECLSVFADSRIARVFFLYQNTHAALPIHKRRAPRAQVEHPPWRDCTCRSEAVRAPGGRRTGCHHHRTSVRSLRGLLRLTLSFAPPRTMMWTP